MEVDVGVEVVAAEGIHQCGETLRDVAVTQMFAHDGAVLGFSLGVVVAVPGARFRLLFDEQFIE